MLDTVENIINLGRSEVNSMPTLAKTTKAGEEFGEFCQAILYENGFLPHKHLDESSISECADVMICMLDAISSTRTDLTTEQIAKGLNDALVRKSQKWVKVMKILSEQNVK